MASYGYSTDVGKAVTARQSVLYNLIRKVKNAEKQYVENFTHSDL